MNGYLEWLTRAQREVGSVIKKGMESGDPSFREACSDVLQMQWAIAAHVWKRYGNACLIDSLIESGWSPPVEVARALLKPPRRRGTPPKVGTDPETVVKMVRWASMLGHPFRGGSAADNPAYVQVARLLGCHPGHVQRLYKQVPRERREELRVRAQWIHDQMRGLVVHK